jgi:hypothetical protein
VVSLLAGCSSTAAGPPPFSASPAPSVGTVVAPIPSSSPTTSASAPTPTASESRTSVTPSSPVSTPPTAGAIQTSYPGIKKLVIVKSRWNNTPAGQAALGAVASYNSYLTLVPALGTTEPLSALFLPSCTSCREDVRNDTEIIKDGYRFRSQTGDIRPIRAVLVIEWQLGSKYMVRADVQQPAAEVVDRSGKIIVTSPAKVISTESKVETATGSGKIIDYFAAE